MTAARSGGLGRGVGALPAGPFSGAQVSVWRTRTGTADHGDRSCPSLSRSTPVEHPHELGAGATLDELDWPTGLHCRPAFTDPALRQYFDEAVAVGALREQAQVALDAVRAAVPNRQYDPDPGNWDWSAMAPALAGALHVPRPLPEDPGLAALWQETIDQLRAAAEQIRAEVVPGPDSWLTANGREGLASLHRLCAAQLAHADYDGRRPGPRFVAYREAVWSAAEATLLAVDPEARGRRGRHTVIAMRGVFSKTRVDPEAHRKEADAALDADAHSPLRDSLYNGGQESLTHHRLYDRAHEPQRPWADTFRRWADGASFGVYGADWHLRSLMLRPAVLDRVLAPLAAADAAGNAWLDGLAAGAQRPMVVVLEVSGYLWSEWNWLPGALLLTAPAAATPPVRKAKTSPPPRRFETVSRMVLVLPEVAATAIRKDERIAVPVAEAPTAAELQTVAAALRDVPDRTDERVYRHYLEDAVRALPTGGRR